MPNTDFVRSSNFVILLLMRHVWLSSREITFLVLQRLLLSFYIWEEKNTSLCSGRSMSGNSPCTITTTICMQYTIYMVSRVTSMWHLLYLLLYHIHNSVCVCLWMYIFMSVIYFHCYLGNQRWSWDTGFMVLNTNSCTYHRGDINNIDPMNQMYGAFIT